MKPLNIFCCVQSFNWENENLIKSLVDMGHKVTNFDFRSEGYDQYDSNWLLSGKKAMNDELLKRISKVHSEEKIDLFFGYLSDPVINPDYIKEISSWNITTLNFGCNDVNSFERGHSITAPFFDQNWTTNSAAVDDYKAIGAKVICIPFGINPKFYSVNMNTLPKLSFDVSFIGQPYGYRLSSFINLIKVGLSYAIMGKVSHKRFIRTVLESRVNIGFSGLGNASFADTSMKQLRLRDFEITALGGLYLTERIPDLENQFEDKKEILMYSTIEELIEKAMYYSRYKNRKERLEIARAGRIKCLNEYTWEKRFTKVFNHMGLI